MEENNNRIVILLGEKCMFHVYIKCINQIWRQHTPAAITLANNATVPFHFQHYIFNSQYILNDSRKHSNSCVFKRDKQCILCLSALWWFERVMLPSQGCWGELLQTVIAFTKQKSNISIIQIFYLKNNFKTPWSL